MSQIENYSKLDQWYATGAGRLSAELVRRQLQTLQQDSWGQHAIYCGPAALCDEELTSATEVHRSFLMHPDARSGQFRGTPDALPVASNTVDLLVLAHALELSAQPHRVLREAERVLVANGRLVLAGFNPWSCYGLRRLFAPWKFPWSQHFYGSGRVRDWLSVLNLETEACTYTVFRPPIHNAVIQRSLQVLEHQSRWRWNHFGGVCCIRARKLRLPLTPTREPWYRPSTVLSDALAGAEPTTRI